MPTPGEPRPLVSVTVPLAPDADPGLAEICLRSISAQTYQAIETLVFLSDGANKALVDVVDRFGPTRLIRGSATKSAARNLLVRQTNGKYLLYVDHDMELSPRLIEDCVNLALEKQSKAIVAAQREAESSNFWRRCRALEWDLLEADIGAGSPYFLLSSTVAEVGGFDEMVDMWDDWVMTLRIMAAGIRIDRVASQILMRDSTNLVEMFVRKYQRGRFLRALQDRYSNAPQARFGERFRRVYIRNWKTLLRSPLLSLGLAFLKLIDVMGLILGRARPLPFKPVDGTRRYFETRTADVYDDVRYGDAFNRFKHYSELRALRMLLDPIQGSVVEVGCGTGRITAELIGSGICVTPVDPSPAMLRGFSAKLRLPPPVQADGRHMPFKRLAFAGAVSLRVVWHLPSRRDFERMLLEMSRVASDFVIIDISNEARWRQPVLKLLAGLYFLFDPSERRHHASSQVISLGEVVKLAEGLGLQYERSLPLDALTPIWLRLLPAKIASGLTPILTRLEPTLARLVPPGRYLIRFAKHRD